MARAAKPRSTTHPAVGTSSETDPESLLPFKTDDENVAWELITARIIRDAAGRTVRTEYLDRDSEDERNAKAALVRVLRNCDRELNPAFRVRLAAFFDDNHPLEARKLVFENRQGGEQPDHALDFFIADTVAGAVKSGVQVEAAVQSAVDRYGVSRSKAYRAWEKHKDFLLPGKRSAH